jgi:hypothetical protein
VISLNSGVIHTVDVPFPQSNLLQKEGPGQAVANLYFEMPFTSSAVIKITNYNDVPIVIMMQAEWNEEYQNNPAYFMVFFKEKMLEGEDMQIVNVQGVGQYFGMNLFVRIDSLDIQAHWWNEHIDKIVVDGEVFFGTGLEDYFCTAFGFRCTFTTEHAGVTFINPEFGTLGINGIVSPRGDCNMYRFHIENPISFQRNFSIGFIKENENIPKFFNLYYRSLAFMYMKEMP